MSHESILQAAELLLQYLSKHQYNHVARNTYSDVKKARLKTKTDIQGQADYNTAPAESTAKPDETTPAFCVLFEALVRFPAESTAKPDETTPAFCVLSEALVRFPAESTVKPDETTPAFCVFLRHVYIKRF
jgi:hypothetical protein